MTEAARLIDALGLAAHPEGGWYRETWRAPAAPGQRPAGTAILFLLAAGEVSHWHRIDATEIWHHHAGAPLSLLTAPDENGPAVETVLQAQPGAVPVPQGIVPPGHWQSARSLGAWTLVGCTVTPGFQFEGFELAPRGFDIPRG